MLKRILRKGCIGFYTCLYDFRLIQYIEDGFLKNTSTGGEWNEKAFGETGRKQAVYAEKQ